MNVLKLSLIFLTLASCKDPAFPETPRATARAAVLAASNGVKATAAACSAIVEEAVGTTDPATKANAISFGTHCRNVLSPAIDGVIMAAEAVDAWDMVSAQKVGCGLKAAEVGLKAAADIILLSGHKVPAWLIDTIAIAHSVSPWAPSTCDPKYPTNEVSAIYVGTAN